MSEGDTEDLCHHFEAKHAEGPWSGHKLFDWWRHIGFENMREELEQQQIDSVLVSHHIEGKNIMGYEENLLQNEQERYNKVSVFEASCANFCLAL